MYNEPQISRRGEWGDAAIVENNKGKIDYYCQYCNYKCREIKTIKTHLVKCIANFDVLVSSGSLIDGVDFIVCKICNFHGKTLGSHLRKIHNFNVDSYKLENNCKTITDKSKKAYSENNYQWLPDQIAKGIDLTEYCQKMGKAVQAAIMSNPAERARRAEVMAKVNQSDVMRQKSSDTAKITSARPDIIKNRTKQLQDWRDDNPEDFFNKCTLKMLKTYQSKPERKLFEFISELEGFKFKRNQFVHSKLFISKSQKKQIDIADKKQRIYIEYDGQLHFIPYHGEDNLKDVKIKDKLLEEHISLHHWTLIRISYDQYIDKNKIEKSYFKTECLTKLVEILNNKMPGIYKIGKAYE